MSITKEKQKVVLFTGAGASVRHNIPTMPQFSNAIQECEYFRNNDLVNDFYAVQRYCNAIAEGIGESARNIESLASILESIIRCRPNDQIPGANKLKDPKTALNKILIAISEIANPIKSFPRLKQPVWESVQQSSRSPIASMLAMVTNIDYTIITTNYDIFHEMEVWQCGGGISYLGLHESTEIASRMHTLSMHSFANFSGIPDARSAPCVKVVKLHGSTNWLPHPWHEGAILIEDRVLQHGQNGISYKSDRMLDKYAHEQQPIAIASLNRDNIAGSGATSFLGCNPHISNKEIPKIIVPTLFKNDHEHLSRQWVAAAEALQTAEQIIFAGYSFPSSDTYMRYFLNVCLSGNVKVRKIYVINPDVSVWTDRIGDIFGSVLHKEILQYIPAKLEEISISELLLGKWNPDLDSDWFRKAESGKRIRDTLGI